MRKFLDFVTQDGPILAPPSEYETSPKPQDVNDLRSRQSEDTQYSPKAASGTKDVVHDPGQTFDQASEIATAEKESQQGDLLAIDFDYSHPRKKHGKEQEHRNFAIAQQLSASVRINGQHEVADYVLSKQDAQEEAQYEMAKKPSGRALGELRQPRQQSEGVQISIAENCKSNKSGTARIALLSRSDNRLRQAAQVLSRFSSGVHNGETFMNRENGSAGLAAVISALREIAETMVWADQHEHSLWDTFLECSIMPLLARCLEATIVSKREVRISGVEGSEGAYHGRTEFCRAQETNDQGVGSTILQEEVSGPHRCDVEVHGSAERLGKLESTSLPNAAAISTKEFDQRTAQAPNTVDLEEHSKVIGQFSTRAVLDIQSQVLRSLSIMIQSVFRQQSLLCLFSSNHINEILSFDFHFENDEMLGYFMSAVKTIALKLDRNLLQLFFDPSRNEFPMYDRVVQFFDHREQMVRIAVRNITLTIYDLGDSEVLRFASCDRSMYLSKTVDLLARLCGSVAHAFELLMDDGREVRRTRSRTGIFRQRVRVSELVARLEEIENLLAYLADAASISRDTLQPLLVRLLTTKLFSPFFRPVASRACPKAIEVHERWRLASRVPGSCAPALAIFDASARVLLLAYILMICRSSGLGHSLVRELSRALPEFEDRSVLHALKAMVSDVDGTERVTFVSLCAVEAFVLCDSTTKQVMRSSKYDLEAEDNVSKIAEADLVDRSLANTDYHAKQEHPTTLEEPMLMTLSKFEAPVTPSNSVPSTPTLVPRSPSDCSTPPTGLTRVRLNTSLSTDELTSLEYSESDEVLKAFQLGEVSLRDTIASVSLVMRKREVRTLRVIHGVCRVLHAVALKTSNYKQCVGVCKIILNETARSMQSFLRNKRTTIVLIERMFENFRAASEVDVSMYKSSSDLGKILSPDSIAEVAADFPKGAGKRRRAPKDDATPPTEPEDAAAFFIMLHSYETAVNNYHDRGLLGSVGTVDHLESLLSKKVLKILLKCSLEDSYLEKRDALQDVASTILKHQDLK